MKFREGQPIYLQIAERLMDEIMAGQYKADERVPGVRDYSVLLQVNINTTVKAFDVLAQRGILYTKRGLGYFVAADAQTIIHATRREDFLNQQLPDLAHSMQMLNIPLPQVSQRLELLLENATDI